MWRLLLWGVVLAIPISLWLAHHGAPSAQFTRASIWTFRTFVAIALGTEIVKWLRRAYTTEYARYMKSIRTRTTTMVAMIVTVAGVGLYVQFASLDGIVGAIGTLTDTPVTQYAPRYTDAGFRTVHEGMSREELLKRLGPPLEETWGYGCGMIFFQWTGHVGEYSPPSCKLPQIPVDANRASVLRLLGEPPKMVWMYSLSPDRSSYRERVINLENGIVTKKHSGLYFD